MFRKAIEAATTGNFSGFGCHGCDGRIGVTLLMRMGSIVEDDDGGNDGGETGQVCRQLLQKNDR